MFIQATADDVAAAVGRHITLHGGVYGRWYVGVSQAPADRLVNGHNADGKRNAARYWDARTSETARAVERHFLTKGCRGGGGGGDSDAKYVYVYKIDRATREE